MSTLLQIGLANAVCAALLAVPAVVAGRLRRPALAHGLWLLVLVKLVTPPLFPVTLPWLPPDAPPPTPAAPAGGAVALHETWAVVPAATPAPYAAAPGDMPAPTAVPATVELTPAAEAPATAVPIHVAATPPSAEPANWTGLLAAAWVVGAAVWFLRAGVLLARFRRLLRFAKPAPEDLQDEARRLAAGMGIWRAPAVWLLPGPIPPMVWAALGSARVYFPGGLLERLGDDERAALLAHELAHVRRGDHWVRRLELVVGGLYWWYPLTWWARRRMQAHEEECCDAWAAAVTPARAYAEAILKAVDFLAGAARTPALASGLGRARDLKRRLTLILCGTAPRRLTAVGRLALLAGAALVLPLGPVLSQAEPPAAPASPAASPAPAPAAERADEAPLAPQPVSLLGGNNEVFSVAVSPDGGTLAAAVGYWDRPGQIAVWDLGARRIVRTFPTPLGPASVVFSPDGRRVGAAGYDAHGYVWDLTTGRPQFSLALDGPGRLAFSPDGKFIATATEAKTVKLWDGASGKEIAALQGDLLRFHCVTFSRDGARLAAGGGDWDGRGPSQVTLWDVKTQKQVGKLPADKPVLAVAFSPDSGAIATGDVANAVKVWDAASLKVKTAFQGHQAWVEGLAFSPDGKVLASAGHDSTARLWDLGRGAGTLSLVGNAGPVRSVAFTPDGKTLVTGGGDRTVRLWDAATGKEVATLLQNEGAADEAPALLAVAFSPDGKTLALAAGDGTVQLRDAASGELRRTIPAHGEKVTCLAFSPDGKRLATGSPDKTVRLWDAGSGEELRVFEGHTGWVYAVAFSPDGKRLASGGYDRTVRLWDADAGKEVHMLTGHKAAVRAVAFAPDGKLLASAGADGTVRLWNSSDFSEKETLKGHEGVVRAVAFAPDGNLLASASEDGTARVWTAEGRETAVLKGHGGEVVAVAFSPQGALATGGADAVVRLWDPAAGTAAGTLTGCSDAVTSLAFAADGRLAAACRDKTVKVWKPAKK